MNILVIKSHSKLTLMTCTKQMNAMSYHLQPYIIIIYYEINTLLLISTHIYQLSKFHHSLQLFFVIT